MALSLQMESMYLGQRRTAQPVQVLSEEFSKTVLMVLGLLKDAPGKIRQSRARRAPAFQRP